MSYRRITADGIEPPKHSPLDRGEKPEFAWIRVAHLRVDDSYQRPLKRANITAIRRIAERFDWLKFGALDVAPIARETADGPQLYAVMNGQHRAHALAVLKIDAAPCLVKKATPAQQAAAFAAINGAVIRVLPLVNFAALVRAEDPAALTLTAICAEAGVTICKYPVPTSHMLPGQTLALSTLDQCAKRYGRDTLILALKCITKTSNNVPGAVHANVIAALCEVIGGDPRLQREGAGLIKRFDAIELDTLDSDSRALRPRQFGDTARARLRDAIKAALDARRAAA